MIQYLVSTTLISMLVHDWLIALQRNNAVTSLAPITGCILHLVAYLLPLTTGVYDEPVIYRETRKEDE
jgi:hypothetical protein